MVIFPDIINFDDDFIMPPSWISITIDVVACADTVIVCTTSANGADSVNVVLIVMPSADILTDMLFMYIFTILYVPA